MGYRQPKRRLTDRDPPDPKLFREGIAPAAQEYAGRLNEHNVVSNDLVATTRFAPSFLYDFHYASVDVDGGIDTNAVNPDYPDAADPSAFKIDDSGAWQSVSDITQSYTTGEHVAWCICGFYYGLLYTSPEGFDAGPQARKKARVQFALRVNGTVIYETITGTERPDDPAPRTMRPLTPIVDPTIFKSIDYETLRGAGAMSWPVKTIRLQCNVRLPAGATTVELVARRVINDDPPVSTLASAGPAVYVYNRRMLVVEQKLGGSDSQGEAPVTVDYPEAGDPLDAAHTDTTQLQPIVTAANDLPADAIMRGGLRKEHLTRTQRRAFYEQRIVVGNTTANLFPGFGNAGTIGASPNWVLVDNGAGTSLRVKLNDGSGFWNFTNNPAFMLILGNVALKEISTSVTVNPGGGSAVDRLPCHYAVLGCGLTYSGGGTSMAPEDQLWTNNANSYHSGDTADPFPVYTLKNCYTDIPLLSYYDFRSAPPAGGPVDYVRLLISAWNAGQIEWDRGSIFVILFYP